jgi:hypothetical protein
MDAMALWFYIMGDIHKNNWNCTRKDGTALWCQRRYQTSSGIIWVAVGSNNHVVCRHILHDIESHIYF